MYGDSDVTGYNDAHVSCVGLEEGPRGDLNGAFTFRGTRDSFIALTNITGQTNSASVLVSFLPECDELNATCRVLTLQKPSNKNSEIHNDSNSYTVNRSASYNDSDVNVNNANNISSNNIRGTEITLSIQPIPDNPGLQEVVLQVINSAYILLVYAPVPVQKWLSLALTYDNKSVELWIKENSSNTILTQLVKVEVDLTDDVDDDEAGRYDLLLGTAGLQDDCCDELFQGRMSCLQLYDTKLLSSKLRDQMDSCLPQPRGLWPLSPLFQNQDLSGNQNEARLHSVRSSNESPHETINGSSAFLGSRSSYIEIQNIILKVDNTNSFIVLGYVALEKSIVFSQNNSSVNASVPLFEFRDNESGKTKMHLIVDKEQRISLLLKDKSTAPQEEPNVYQVQSATTLIFGKWYFVGFSIQKEGSSENVTVSVYVNGKQDAVVRAKIEHTEIKGSILLGCHTEENYQDAVIPFMGKMACFQVYDVALTERETEEAMGACDIEGENGRVFDLVSNISPTKPTK
ncbi:uncharacterized protein LOC106167904 [Lingula anatina]|uniref:Uncharacterized protein LOC106167904 n=1 Tax=Lingula anatina TaxID=7574 RepID=A0A1S3IW14_LINAN|nr:uncharacterized protein LOC106167904 [Lingula anatina]|eukprot:XP_013402253.1 uncharacterized protein LOC106167904 [Lingula anatina]